MGSPSSFGVSTFVPLCDDDDDETTGLLNSELVCASEAFVETFCWCTVLSVGSVEDDTTGCLGYFFSKYAFPSNTERTNLHRTRCSKTDFNATSMLSISQTSVNSGTIAFSESN